MLKEKKFILVNLLVWFFASVFLIIFGYCYEPQDVYSIAPDTCIIFGFTFAICFIIMLFFGPKCKCYHYEKFNIVIYAGYRNHYLKINDEIYDEYVCSFVFSPIKLSASLENGTLLEATLSPSNTIKLKVNGKLYRNH